jgi:DNA-binding CsgD family transcriptional regulator
MIRRAPNAFHPPNAGLLATIPNPDNGDMPRAYVRGRRANLVERVQRSRDATEAFVAASARLRELVPHDAAAWLGADPGTGLPTSPVVINDLDDVSRSQCSAHWQHELLDDDVNLFRDLARADSPAAALRAVLDEPDRSARFRRFVSPLGFDDELRAILRVGDVSWGSITLWRREGQQPFSDVEVAMVAGLSAPIGEALRRHARPIPLSSPVDVVDRPGLVLFTVEGEIVSLNDDARYWLDQLPEEPGVASGRGAVPVWMLITVFRAAALRHGAGDGTARTRVRTARGRWLACHASCLDQSGNGVDMVALVIEPAAPAAVAPIVVESYDLTDREQQVVHLVARGAGTVEIAEQLFVSPHTVRDHLKAIFSKAQVSSRGELVAKMFAEFYEPQHTTDIVHLH